MQFSTLPFLVAAVIAFPSIAAFRCHRRNDISSAELRYVIGYSLLLATWAGVLTGFAWSGFYQSDVFIAAHPMLWFPFIGLLVASLPIVFLPRLRCPLKTIGMATPRTWFAALQATRIAAIGTAIKTCRGEFPVAVEWLLGVPDLLFGFSAVVMICLLQRGVVSTKAWFIWNLTGALIIVPIGMVVINLSMPGVFQVFTEEPTFEVVFDSMLALAPTFVVPLQGAGNIWSIINIRLHGPNGRLP